MRALVTVVAISRACSTSLRGILPLPPLPPVEYSDPDQAQASWEKEVQAIVHAEKRTLSKLIGDGLSLEVAEKTWQSAANKQLGWERHHLTQLLLTRAVRPARAEDRLRDDTNAAKAAHRRVHASIAKELADADAESLHPRPAKEESSRSNRANMQIKHSALRQATAYTNRINAEHQMPPICLLDCIGIKQVRDKPSLSCFAYAATHAEKQNHSPDDLSTDHHHTSALHRCTADCSPHVVTALRKYAEGCGQVEPRVGELY